MCIFMIHIFKTSEQHRYPGHILLEFQRRQGDAFVFQRLYRLVVDELKSQGLVQFSGNPNDEDPTVLPSVLPSLPLPGELTVEAALLVPELAEGPYLDFSRDQSLCDNLIRMCRSIYLEPRREATSVLARGSRAAKNATLLATVPQIIATLMKLLQDCSDLQVTRNTAVILSNLFEHVSSSREETHKHRLFKIMAQVLSRWSGADATQRTPLVSKLVCCELGRAMELLTKEERFRQSFSSDTTSINYLKQIEAQSPIPEAKGVANRVLNTIAVSS